MVDANEKDEAPISNTSPGKDADQSVNASITSTKSTIEKTVGASGIIDMEEEENHEEEEEEEDYEGEEEEGEYEEEEEEEEEGEEGKIKEGGISIVAVNNGVNVDEEHNKGKAMVEEKTNEDNVVKEDAIKGEDKEKTEEPKNGQELGENSKTKGKKPRKKNKKKAEQLASGTVATDGDKAEPSRKKNASKRVESMGMVFMCSSKTKTDCFRYKILGLPASKKDQVAKIYRGMRLFLFDVDLRLMYGIFKAAGPGGYNVEPKAFKSEFPSQVRFTVLEDCLPLAEEKFKDVIKENYFTRSKFEGQLNAEQVKKLCKLFVVTGKATPRRKPTLKARRTGAVENPRPRPVERRRPRPDESRRPRSDSGRRTRLDDGHTSRDRTKRKRRAREDDRRPRSPLGREKRRYTEYELPPVLYERGPPVPRYLPPPLPPPVAASPVRSYAYERALDPPHSYVRERVPEHQAYHVLDLEPRHHEEIYSRGRDRDPYSVHDTGYPLPPEYHLVSREYHHPPPPLRAVQPVEYPVPSYRDVGPGPEYRSSVASLSEYRPHRTHYRY